MNQKQTNTRGTNGRFVPGNPGGPGNPHAGQVSKLRAAILHGVDEDDIQAIIEQLVAKARNGDLAAAREILDRTVGKSAQADFLERIEALEAAADRLDNRGDR